MLQWWEREQRLARPHPETRRPIAEMLELERVELLPLPAAPYDTRDVVVRLVDDYQRVRFETNHYPVPAPIGDLVYVCADMARLEICDRRARRLVEHERLPDGAGMKLTSPGARRARYDLDELEARVAQWGESAAAFAAGVRETRRYAGAELVRLLQLVVGWSTDDIVAAMSRATEFRCFEVAKVVRILEATCIPRRFEEQIADLTRRRIQEVMRDHPVSQRSLSSYETLRTGDREHRSQARQTDEEIYDGDVETDAQGDR